MKTGPERNKIILLLVLTVILGFTVYVQFFASSQRAPAVPRRAAETEDAAPERAPTAAPARQTRPSQTRGRAFRPKFARSDSDQELDLMSVDPTLRTDLLAKVRAVEFQGVQRNIFQFGEKKQPVPPPSKEKLEEAQKRLAMTKPPDPAKAAQPRSPQAPPITFKYFGYAQRPGDSRKRAFLLDGEEILIGGEGDVFKQRYKIVNIGVNSIVVEDMQHNNQQTLRLQEG